MTYKGKGGKQYDLSQNPFAQGGEGKVYTVNGNSQIVAKLYKNGLNTVEKERKLITMVDNPPDKTVMTQISWPLDVLYDSSNTFVGFVMPRLNINEELNVIYEYGSTAKYPNISWTNKIIIAKNLCAVLDAVHSAGHVVGDLNPKNISVDPNTGHVVFVDTDSYHIEDNGTVYRCNVGMPEYLPVEIQRKMKGGLSAAPLPTFSNDSDNFALAVHIFQLLMNGTHPFACRILPSQASVVFPQPSDNIMNGVFPFMQPKTGIAIPAYAPEIDILPNYIRTLFSRAFIDGHTNPSARPTPVEWYNALTTLSRELKKCKNVNSHEYLKDLHKCPWCEADGRFSSVMTTTSKPTLVQTAYTPPSPPKASSYSTLSTSNTGYNSSATSTVRKKTVKPKIIKKLISTVVFLGLLGALFGFLIWPKLIYPNMPNENLYTPEIVQTYCNSNLIIQITGCTEDGIVTAVCESISGGSYSKTNLKGKIVDKKNNGNLVIQWTEQIPEIMTGDSSFTLSDTAKIKNDWTEFTTGGNTLSVGTNDAGFIETASDLSKLANSDELFILKNDIDLSGQQWTPIQGFSGILIGNGYSIKNLSINSSSNDVGFFDKLQGTINNIKFENANVNVTGSRENVGIVCGILESGNIINVTVSGTVTAGSSTSVGGVAGKFTAGTSQSLSGIKNEANVSGKENVGGIFGSAKCYIGGYKEATLSLSLLENSGDVKASGNYVGGIIGHYYSDAYDNKNFVLYATELKNTGDVSGAGYVGGLFGYAYSDGTESYIRDSISSADITAQYRAGGLAGQLANIQMSDCENDGSTLTVTKYETIDGVKYAYIGGFAGEGYLFNNCINTISINYTSDGKYVGGIAGYVYLTGNQSMSNLENEGNITGAEQVGGIFGGVKCYIGGYKAATLTLSMFENSGDIEADGSYAGGIIGHYYSDAYDNKNFVLYATELKNTGDVSGAAYVGGWFGYAYTDSSESFVQDSVSRGTISGNSYTDKYIGYSENVTID